MDVRQNTEQPADIVPKRLGRKPRAAVTEKIATLEAQLIAARAEAREVARARATIVGAAVIEAMGDSPEFARRVVEQLRERVRSARDRTAIADLLL